MCLSDAERSDIWANSRRTGDILPRRAAKLGRASPSRNLGVALSNRLRESGIAVDDASTVEGRVRDEAGTFAGHIHDPAVFDIKSGLAKGGVELGRSHLCLVEAPVPHAGNRASTRATCIARH
jgi:hypothetical protein